MVEMSIHSDYLGWGFLTGSRDIARIFGLGGDNFG